MVLRVDRQLVPGGNHSPGQVVEITGDPQDDEQQRVKPELSSGSVEVVVGRSQLVAGGHLSLLITTDAHCWLSLVTADDC